VLGVRICAPEIRDAEVLADVLNAHARSTHGADSTTVAEVRAWFSFPELDPTEDMRIAVAPGGAVLGYADIVGAAPGPLHVDIRIPPANEAVAGPLLAEMERRAAVRGAPPRPLRVHALGGDDVIRGVLETKGYRAVRSSFHMEASLAAPPSPPRWPEGIAVRAYRVHDDLVRVYETCEAAFADHWGYRPASFDEWRGWNVRETLEPSLWFLAEDGDALAGVCLCRPDETPDEALGWVSTLGVRPPWRRRGLAQALLLHAFAALRARGCDRVGLGVDAENTTGAVALYERVGMLVVRRDDTYERTPA
jgi:mycothiol synthase